MTQLLRRDALRRLEAHFELRERGSSVRTEVLGGLSTFLAMSYIVLVNPVILAKGGIPWEAAFLATAVVSGLATLAMGLWARLPFAVGPGMEINALVVLSVIDGAGFTWQQALGLVFWSGVLMVAVTGFGWRSRVIDAIPAEVRSGLLLSVGVFIAVVGLKVSGLLDGSQPWPRALGSHDAIALYLGLGVTVVLSLLRVRVATLIGILTAAVYLLATGLRPAAPAAADSASALFSLDLGAIARPSAWGLLLVLFALDFFGSTAKVIGLSARTSIQRAGEVPRLRQALYVDSAATLSGAVMGSTSFVTFVESGVGIRAGARTGLAAVTTGLLLLLCAVFTPIAGWIPASAAAGALLFVAIGTLPSRAEVRATGWVTLLISVVMAAVTAVTAALDQALLAGLILYLLAGLVRRDRAGRPHPVLVVVIVLLAASVTLQYAT